MKDGSSKLNPNSAPFSPAAYDYAPPTAASPSADNIYYNANYDWWCLPQWRSQRLNSPATLSKALTLCRQILEDDLHSPEISPLISYLNSGRLVRTKGLLSHPLSQLFVPPPRQRYIHPAITDHCLYALRVDRSDGKFCLTFSKDCPGFENDLQEDWLAAVVAFLHYGLAPIRASLDEHTCVRNVYESCWLCELFFVFENLDQSRREGLGQPVSLRAFADSLMSCPAMNSLAHDASGDDAQSISETSDSQHGLLSRRLYRRLLRSRQYSQSPLLNEIYTKTTERTNDDDRRWTEPIYNGARIRKRDRKLIEEIEANRGSVYRKVLYTLNYILHMLNRVPATRRSTEFPRLGESPNAHNEELEMVRIFVSNECTCSLTKEVTSTTKDMTLLPLSYRLHEQHRSNSRVPTVSPDSSELSAFEDSIQSAVSSASESSASFRSRSLSGRGSCKRKPSFNVFTAAASGSLPRRQTAIKFVELVADSLVRESEVLMTCPSCCRSPNAVVKPHRICEAVTKLPVVLGLKTEGCDDYWKGAAGDMRLLVRKYLKAKRQGSSRESMLSTELARLGSSNTLPSQLHIGFRNNRWDVRSTRAPGYAEYSLIALISAENTVWDQDTRSTLWRIWNEDMLPSRDLKKLLHMTEVEELLVERPPSEDLVVASIKRSDGTWVMVNGPLVAEVTEADAKAFGVSYRRPICVFYARTGLLWSWKRPTNCKLPDFDTSRPWNRSLAANHLTTPPFIGLTQTERKLIEANKFTLALDAEYVVCSYVLKCKNHLLGSAPRYELGRFTGVRTDSVFKEPLAFADFYVQFSKMPVDCRTEYSGLLPQDLSASTSMRWLLTRDYIYRMVRFLVKNKCRFIGHDLFNDFRVIGITVPSNLVIDTVLLFRLSPQSRLLSLKYLAYTVLHMRIQQGTHDSLEDSWVSLLLYRFYLKYLKDHGEDEFVTDFVNQIYSTGYNTKFRTPT